MDLIYQNADRVDEGVMKHYEMDMAYGKDENDFVLTMDLDGHCLEEGYILYMEGTEYGGIVDRIKVSNVDNTVCYSGRTWHGVLEGKVMEPHGSNDYLLLNGNANEVLRELIEKWNLTDLFTVSAEESPVDIINYKVRYVTGYTGIRQMLFASGGKLIMKYRENRVELSAVPYIDYSQDEEFDSSQVYFTAEKDYRPLNHLICAGLGESNEPYTIHLFCDEYKGLQAYAVTDMPIKDSDYILTKENQKLYGKDEVAEVLDNGSVQIVKNYILLNEMPAGWDINADTWNDRFDDIYTLDENNSFKQAEAKEQKVYELQTSQPNDWKTNHDDYYVIGGVNEDGETEYEHPKFEGDDLYRFLVSKPLFWERNFNLYYEKVTKMDNDGNVVTDEYGNAVIEYRELEYVKGEERYEELTSEPPDWNNHYESYYTRHNNGLGDVYSKVSSVTKYEYKKQKSQPSDWNTNYAGYYQKSGSSYVQVLPKYKKVTSKPKKWASVYADYYQRINDGTAITYKQVASVSKESYELQKSKPSDWKENYKSYYLKEQNAYKTVSGDSTPAWKKKTYYTKKTEQTAPAYDSVKPVYSANAPEWGKCPRYTRESKTVAPKWKAGMYYVLAYTIEPPPWRANTYYEKVPQWKADTYYTEIEKMVAPVWKEGCYYRQYLDHYARLVEKGMEHLQKKINCDKIDISLELENIYDINDVIGARENITGLSVWMPITKKIVKITDTTETVEYEVGE